MNRKRRLDQASEQIAQMVQSPHVVLHQDPDEDPNQASMNDQRAGWAHASIVEFIMHTGVDAEDAVADLIADLAHWCDRHGLSVDHQIERAIGNYQCETQGSGSQFQRTEVTEL